MGRRERSRSRRWPSVSGCSSHEISPGPWLFAAQQGTARENLSNNALLRSCHCFWVTAQQSSAHKSPAPSLLPAAAFNSRKLCIQALPLYETRASCHYPQKKTSAERVSTTSERASGQARRFEIEVHECCKPAYIISTQP